MGNICLNYRESVFFAKMGKCVLGGGEGFPQIERSIVRAKKVNQLLVVFSTFLFSKKSLLLLLFKRREREREREKKEKKKKLLCYSC